jgi:hypothetical protein
LNSKPTAEAGQSQYQFSKQKALWGLFSSSSAIRRNISSLELFCDLSESRHLCTVVPLKESCSDFLRLLRTEDERPLVYAL